MYARIYAFLITMLFVLTAQASPDIQHWVTDSGVRVYFVEAHELPMMDVQIAFDAGSARDGEKPGLALLTNAMLSEGAAGMNADEVSQNFENLGAVFSSSANMDSASLGVRVVTEPDKLDAALKNLNSVITQPDFPKRAFERERNRMLTAIRQKQQSPDALAKDAFYKAIYGDHPYSQPEEGTEASLSQISVKDLAAFHQQYYVASNVIVAIVGDLDRAGAEKVVSTLTTGLPAGEKAPEIPEVKPLAAATNVEVDHPSTQTHLLVGQPGITRADPDLFPVYVGNHILGGGGMVSRLFEQIREKRGLSYSAYSYFMPMRQAGPFVAGLQTRNDQAAEALQLLKEELRMFIENGPTAEELDAAKKNLTGGFALRVDSNSDIMNYIVMIGYYGLPLDYLDVYNDKIMGVTAEQIKQAFAAKLDPDKMVAVLVGQNTEQKK